MTGRLESLLEDALGQDVRWDGFFTQLGDLAIIRVRVFQWQVIPCEHVVL